MSLELAMADDGIDRMPGRNDNWIRLRTLLLLRWWAILGQAAALIVAQRLYRLDLETALCVAVIGIAAISNVVASLLFPENKRLSERGMLLVVLFDMLELGLLLFLTGGLHNPFSILIVGPVTVSASALSSRSTAFLGLMAIVIVSVLIRFNLPLRTEDGLVLRIPDLLLLGNWAAIVIAVVFLGVYSRWIVKEMTAMSEALQATQLALAREQKLTDLGGVVAATAHELGTPLATIKLTSTELAEELSQDAALREDALLIAEQADRCRDILRSMGKAGKDDLHLRGAPLSAVIEEAADPHGARGKKLHFSHEALDDSDASQPILLRRPEVIHGLRNLIQNAVDFARGNVWVESRWSEKLVRIRVMDDGPGYPPHLLGRLGDPPMRRQSTARDPRRPSYEGMGLGLFIAKTLLQRTGADIEFGNRENRAGEAGDGAARSGAIVEVTWPRARIDMGTGFERAPLGQNRPLGA